MGRRQAILCTGVIGLALASGGCNDHRYGFFGEGEGGESTTTGGPDTDGRDPDPSGAPGTVTVTTQSPDPSFPDPSGPSPSEPDPSGSDPSGPSTVTDPTGMPGVCGEQVLPSEVPLHIKADNTGGPTFFGLSCGFEFAAEAVFVWTAPIDGVFRFDTAASSFDTVVAVVAHYCGGPELGCNDDALGSFGSVSTLVLAGQTVTIVIEGRSGEEGPVVLNVNLEDPLDACTFADIGGELGEIVGSTTFGASALGGSCGGDGANEAPFLWQAPFPGLFRFETRNSAFDPVLYVRRGDCSGPEILCTDDFIGAEAGFDLFLTPEDGPQLLVVDGLGPGHAGQYTLAITAL